MHQQVRAASEGKAVSLPDRGAILPRSASSASVATAGWLPQVTPLTPRSSAGDRYDNVNSIHRVDLDPVDSGSKGIEIMDDAPRTVPKIAATGTESDLNSAWQYLLQQELLRAQRRNMELKRALSCNQIPGLDQPKSSLRTVADAMVFNNTNEEPFQDSKGFDPIEAQTRSKRDLLTEPCVVNGNSDADADRGPVHFSNHNEIDDEQKNASSIINPDASGSQSRKIVFRAQPTRTRRSVNT